MEWTGCARTNYVKIEDREGLEQSIAPFSVTIKDHPTEPGYACLFPDNTDDGDFPSSEIDEEGEEIEFSFTDHVMPFVAEGQVLVIQCGGYEGKRYVSGYASAFVRQGDTVKDTSIDLNDIYKKAAQEFGITPKDIAACSYTDLPKSLTESSAQRPKP